MSFRWILVFISIIVQLDCGSLFRKEIPEDALGYKMYVHYDEKNEEVYFFPSEVERMDLSELLAAFSLRQDPSMRFIVTNQSIELFDIMGTRNNFQKEWVMYLDGKFISGTALKKGVTIHQKNILRLRYLEASRMILPKNYSR